MCACVCVHAPWTITSWTHSFITLTLKKNRPFCSESQIPYFQFFMSTKVKALRYPDFNLPHAKVCLAIWAGWVLDSGRQKNLAVWDVLFWAGRIVSFCESSSNREWSTLEQHTVEGLLQMPMDIGSQTCSWRGGASVPLAMSLGNREGNYEKSACDHEAQGLGRKGRLQMENCTLCQCHWSTLWTDYNSSGLLIYIPLQNLNIPRSKFPQTQNNWFFSPPSSRWELRAQNSIWFKENKT